MSVRTTAVCLVAAPIAGLVGTLAMPDLDGTPTEQLEALAAGGSMFLIANAALLLCFVLFALGLSGLAHASDGRRGAWWRVLATSAVTAAVGWILHAAVVGYGMSRLSMAAAGVLDSSAPVVETLYDGSAFLMLLLPMLATTVVGTIGLSIGLWRTGLAPWWGALLVVLGLAADFVAPDGISGIAMFALMAVGLFTCAVRLIARRPAVSEQPEQAVTV